ncbi:MAG: hypothetical protein K6G58_02785 [Lachnospiraceae bacterium]|nr:hypothetical protein [Lachnospiraceae bacterium]
MKKKSFKAISSIMVSVLMSASLAGCAVVPSLEITDEQRGLIAEYAAGKLIEYVKGHPGGLMTLDDVDRADVNPGMKKEELPPAPEDVPEEIPAPVEEPEPAEPAEDAPPVAEDEALVDAPDEIPSEPTMTIAQAFGIEGATVTFDDYETAMAYPENGVELAFSMKAAEGKQLLIAHFLLSNPTDGDIDVHTDSEKFKVRMIVNGGDKVRGDMTFLDNDLMNYHGLLTPGSGVDTVLVFEIPEGQDVTSLDLVIVADESEQTYHLM